MATIKVYSGFTDARNWMFTKNIESQFKMNTDNFIDFLISTSTELLKENNYRQCVSVYFCHREIEILICNPYFKIEINELHKNIQNIKDGNNDK